MRRRGPPARLRGPRALPPRHGRRRRRTRTALLARLFARLGDEICAAAPVRPGLAAAIEQAIRAEVRRERCRALAPWVAAALLAVAGLCAQRAPAPPASTAAAPGTRPEPPAPRTPTSDAIPCPPDAERPR